MHQEQYGLQLPADFRECRVLLFCQFDVLLLSKGVPFSEGAGARLPFSDFSCAIRLAIDEIRSPGALLSDYAAPGDSFLGSVGTGEIRR